jgi:hypothetical protein
MAIHETRAVSWQAVLTILGTSMVGAVMALFHLLLSLLASAGPDSCGTVSCQGDAAVAQGFLWLAAVGSLLVMASWFTARNATARGLICAAAIVVPIIGDLVLWSAAPEWL